MKAKPLVKCQLYWMVNAVGYFRNAKHKTWKKEPTFVSFNKQSIEKTRISTVSITLSCSIALVILASIVWTLYRWVTLVPTFCPINLVSFIVYILIRRDLVASSVFLVIYCRQNKKYVGPPMSTGGIDTVFLQPLCIELWFRWGHKNFKSTLYHKRQGNKLKSCQHQGGFYSTQKNWHSSIIMCQQATIMMISDSISW